MSMESDGELTVGAAPELNSLGKRLEYLRIERGISKQRLARLAGTSRQQLWRVMSGKSELTSALCERLAEVLQVEPAELREWCGGGNGRVYPGPPTHGPVAARSFEEFVADPHAIERTLQTLPPGEAGRRLKRELLNCLEVIAAEEGVRLAAPFFALRADVINGDR
jgi:transcriptional regulator with XRE-family HTH domain